METTINDSVYRIGKMPARTQFHVWRRILPLLMTLDRLPGLLAMAKDMTDEEKAALLAAGMSPLASALSEMKDEDADYVINSCLAVVSRRQGEGPDAKFAPVLASSGILMFSDIEMATMVQLTVSAIQENLGNFFDLLRAAIK